MLLDDGGIRLGMRSRCQRRRVQQTATTFPYHPCAGVRDDTLPIAFAAWFNNRGWRGNPVSATAELNKVAAGHNRVVRSLVTISSTVVYIWKFVAVDQVDCLAYDHTDVGMCFKDVYGPPQRPRKEVVIRREQQ